MSFLSYWFYPNLGTASYDNPKIMLAMSASIGLIALGALIIYWRRRLRNPITKKLSRSWSMASFWLGAVGIVLTVSRAEGIQFFSMRILWLTWGLTALIYIAFQMLKFQRRHYTIIEKKRTHDERDRYLPGRKR